MNHNIIKNKILLLAISFLFITVPAISNSFSLYDLICEEQENPIGIDNTIPRFSWKIESIERGFTQYAYRIIVSSSPDMLEKENLWDSGKVKSSQSILIPYNGKKLMASTTYYWKVRSWNQSDEASDWSNIGHFTMGLLSPGDWGGAKWISMDKDDDSQRVVPAIAYPQLKSFIKTREADQTKNPQFRKEFSIDKPIKRALISISGLGQFDLFLNGEKVGNHFLDPGWTDYDKSVLYVTFDVTDKLSKGNNAIGVMLGGGFYHTPQKRYLKLYSIFGAPKMKMNLRIEYTDGIIAEIISDKTWKASESPISFSSIYGGEDYEATRYQKGWMLPGFDDRNWHKVNTSKFNVPMYSQNYAPIRVRQILSPVNIFKNKDGNWIYDFGQNASGIFRLKIKGKQGQSVTLRPAELLDNENRADQHSSGSPIWYTYKIGSGKTETWQPQFTYSGFRYLEVTGGIPAGQENNDNLPSINELIGLHTSNSAQETGQFSCSKPMFNHIHELIDWAMRSNMTSLLTDCPHREKLGWIEEAYLMQYSLQYRYNLDKLYEKTIRDMQQAQTSMGAIPSICPEYTHFSHGFEDSPEWGSAFIISPYYIYKWYGDKSLIKTYYPEMQKYISYLNSRAKDHIISYGLGDWYDLGKNPPGYSQLTSYGLTATGIYYEDVIIMQKIADLLGKKEDADNYNSLATEIKTAFNKTFFHKENCTYDRNSQTANAFALHFGLVDKKDKERVLQNLINDIRQRGNALTAGDIGYRYVLRTLEENDRQDVIFDMNSRYDVPGYGYQLAHGATSLTESWNALRGLSNNHFMLGHLMEWLYGGLGGIRQQENSVAFNKILITPQIVGDITYANTSYESPYGQICCDWKLNGDVYTLKVSIPANSEAIICLPTKDIDGITDYGRPVTEIKALKMIENKNGKINLHAGSGKYLLKMKIENSSI